MVSFVHSYYTLSGVESFNLAKNVQQVFCISHQSINLTPCSKQNAWSAQSTTLFGIPEYIHEGLGVLSVKKRFWHKYWLIKDWRCSKVCLRLRIFWKYVDFLTLKTNQSKKIDMFTFKDLTLTLSVKKFETATCSEPRNSRIIYYL